MLLLLEGRVAVVEEGLRVGLARARMRPTFHPTIKSLTCHS